MKTSWSPLTVLWLVAGAAILAGCAMTIRNIAVFHQRAGWIAGKTADIQAIESMATSTRNIEAALNTLERMPARQLPELAETAEKTLPDAEKDIEYGAVEPLVEGWSVKHASLALERASPAGVARLLDSVATQRPPWRVNACTLRASTESPGKVHATFSLEGIEASQ